MKAYGIETKKDWNQTEDFTRKAQPFKNTRAKATKRRCNKTLKARSRQAAKAELA